MPVNNILNQNMPLASLEVRAAKQQHAKLEKGGERGASVNIPGRQECLLAGVKNDSIVHTSTSIAVHNQVIPNCLLIPAKTADACEQVTMWTLECTYSNFYNTCTSD
jgi:hypothetical protein